MKLVTSEQMLKIDRETIDQRGIPGLDLMENAGSGIAREIKLILSSKKSDVTIFCGKGNNGGDGFVIGRYLHEARHTVTIYYPSPVEKLSADAQTNFEKANQLDIKLIALNSVEDLPERLETDCIIDAIFGTGFSDSPRGLLKDMIDFINRCNVLTVAVDMPSGLNADNGTFSGSVIEADYTFTLAQPKYGLFISPGREMSGQVEIIPIGIPDDVVDSFNLDCDILTAKKVTSLLPERKPDGHKGDFGRVMVLAGSTGMTGAAILAGKATLRSGCGLVKICCPETILPTIASNIIEAVTEPLPDIKKQGKLALRGLGQIRKIASENDSVIIGPGLGQHFQTTELIRRFVTELDKPMIIDADGLNALVGHTEILKNKKGSPTLTLTPHPGEFKRLLGCEVETDYLKRIEQAKKFATEHGVTLVLKGSPTIIADKNGQCALNPTGNNGMATGGSGDVLSGIIGTLLAQGLSPFDSACAGVYVHGLAGDLAADEFTQRSVIAGDIVDYLSEAFIFLGV